MTADRWEEAFEIWAEELRRRHEWRNLHIVGKNQFAQNPGRDRDESESDDAA